MKISSIMDIELTALVKDLKRDLDHLQKCGINPKTFLNGRMVDQYEKSQKALKKIWNK